LPWQPPLSDREANTKLNIYSHMSTNPGNLAKISLVRSGISLLQAVIKKEKKKKKESNNNRT